MLTTVATLFAATLVHATLGFGTALVAMPLLALTVGVRVATPLRPWAEIWRGLRPLKAALRSGVVRLEGRAELRRAFPQWLKLSVFAPVGRFRQ